MGRVWQILKTMYDEVSAKRLMLISAGVAFYGLLALFPGIGAMVALSGLFTDSQMVADAMDELSNLLPEDAAGILTGQAEAVAGSRDDDLGALAIAGVTVTIYSASKGMKALIDGLNLIHGVDETRGFLAAQALKLALTLGLIVGLFICFAVAAVVPAVLAWLPVAQATEFWISAARWPVLLVIGVFGIALVYRVGPSDGAPGWQWILPGAGLACVLWLGGTAAFALYVRLFGSYQETFGALGGVVILLVWLWLSATVVLAGGLLAHVMARGADARDGVAEKVSQH